MTEEQCLDYCYAYGAAWEQDGVRLYDILDRVSCWCCRNKNQRELRAIHDNLPRYWNQLLGLESRLGTMKSKPLHEIAEPRKSPRNVKTAQTGIDGREDPK